MSEALDRAGAQDSAVVRLGDGLARACVAVAAIALICIVAINGVNVVARYCFGSPFSWAEELMLYLMTLGVFSAGIAVTWRNMHIRIDTLVEQAPEAFRRIAKVLVPAISIAVIATVTVASYTGSVPCWNRSSRAVSRCKSRSGSRNPSSRAGWG
jgi:TRAP-type C4-dicarboxylate transport system permease small subunit